ncbi:Uncharacterised protein [Mycobacteroides abscessus subsp. abscessus]|nr:Uncharacterised protein [Mycobacteroides abscessus subsp. abscessus]
MHHRQVECAGAAHRPSGHSPLAPVITYPKVRGHVRHHVVDEMVGGIATTTVHALGVVVERPGGIREHQHRRVSTVPGGEVVGGLCGVARPYPVRGSVQRRPDHQYRWKPGRRVMPEPCGRQVDQLGTVPESGGIGRNRHRRNDSRRRLHTGDLHGQHRASINLAGDRSQHESGPRRMHGRQIADPYIYRQPGTYHAQRYRKERQRPAPPPHPAPIGPRQPGRQPDAGDPEPQPRRRRFTGDTQCVEIPVRDGGQHHTHGESCDDGHQPRSAVHRVAQHGRGADLSKHRQPAVNQRQLPNVMTHPAPKRRRARQIRHRPR